MHSKEKVLNIARTEEFLLKTGILPSLYEFNSLGLGECHCITYNYLPDEGWAIFFSERGTRSDVKIFDNEHDACTYFIEIVTSSFVYDLKSRKKRIKDGTYIFNDERHKYFK